MPDGYNIGGFYIPHIFTVAKSRKCCIGRNEFVSDALGTTSFDGTTYSTTAQNITGLLPVGSAG